MRRKINSAGTLLYIFKTRLKFKMMPLCSNYNCQKHYDLRNRELQYQVLDQLMNSGTLNPGLQAATKWLQSRFNSRSSFFSNLFSLSLVQMLTSHFYALSDESEKDFRLYDRGRFQSGVDQRRRCLIVFVNYFRVYMINTLYQILWIFTLFCSLFEFKSGTPR